ncbi:MAG: DUF2304 domain-containing protein [Bacteroidales bacterium]|nr:DUF2304 domain-containing protein [Bacteroidales bacterium]
MTSTINPNQVQYIAIAFSLILFFVILFLIRKRRIKEEYSLMWLLFSLVFIVFALWRQGLDVVSGFLGIAYPPAAMLLILLMAVFLIMIEFSMIISKLADKNKNLAQEIGLLYHETEKLKRMLKRQKKQNQSKKEKTAKVKPTPDNNAAQNIP